MSPKQPRRAVGYVRISIDRGEETSTETQEQAIRGYCARPGWSVVDVKVDAGRSGYKASRSTRPKFNEAMELIRSGAANALVVWRLDRLSRSAKDTLILVEELAEHGAELASVTEGELDPSKPTGKLLLTMLSGLAEMESHIKRERVQEWQDHRRAKGMTPTGPRPFGYKKERNTLIIDPVEAAAIRKAADGLLAGQSLRSILRDLTASGAVNRAGKPFTLAGLRVILLGPTIAGCRMVEKRRRTSDGGFFPGVYVQSNEWEPILDRQTWDAVADVLWDAKRRTVKSNDRRWLLAGIIRCSTCLDTDTKGLMRSKGHTRGIRYACEQCGMSVEAQRVDELIEEDVLEMLDATTWRRLRRGQSITEADTSAFDEAMRELSDRFVADEIDAAELASLAERLRQQAKASSAPPPPLPDVADVRSAWDNLDLSQRRLVVAAATESLTLEPAKPCYGFDESRIQWVPVS
jgi:DNA invertase Pin-like site-specific DNA recombinase